MNGARSSSSGRPLSSITLTSSRAVTSPSPVVARSRKITCPLCSPPTLAPISSIRSSTYRSPTLTRSSWMPAARRTRSNPRLLITVTTTRRPGSPPCASRWSAVIPMIEPPPRQPRHEGEVALRGVGHLDDPPDRATRRPGQRRHPVEGALDLGLHRIGQLEPAGGEELDPVVFHRIMGGGEDDAGVHREMAGEVGDPRRGKDAEPQHVR